MRVTHQAVTESITSKHREMMVLMEKMESPAPLESKAPLVPMAHLDLLETLALQ